MITHGSLSNFTEFPFVVHDLDTENHDAYPKLSMVPRSHRWAFKHILEHDCGCLSCGRTVYQIKGQDLSDYQKS